MRELRAVIVTCCVVLAVTAGAVAAESWDLSGVKEIQIDGTSGDVIIRPLTRGEPRLELRSDVRPPENFESRVSEDGGRLRIREKWYGRSRGSVTWTIYLPKDGSGPEVQVSSASGDLECTGVSAAVFFKTASGDIELAKATLEKGSRFTTASGDFSIRDMEIEEDAKFKTASGDIELGDLTIREGSDFTTASGDVVIGNCELEDDVRLASASGDVVVRETKILGEAEFTSASGDVRITLDKLPQHDFAASSASGDVTLSVGDFGDDFTLVLIKRKNRGRISSPFEYTSEREFRDYQKYVEKVVERGSGKPEIILRTASGKVVVKKGR